MAKKVRGKKNPESPKVNGVYSGTRATCRFSFMEVSDVHKKMHAKVPS